MLRILRQLTAEEMRQVAVLCHARPGAAPEEIIRSLARACGVTTWGIFPAATDDVLLDQVGRRLGMPPLTGGPRALLSREWAILVAYFRQAWDAAEPSRRLAVVERALSLWDSSTLPCPMLVDHPDEAEAAAPAWEALLQSCAGCRALAVATETEPLHLPAATLPPAGPFRGGAGRPVSGHQVLYGVLLVLWRARARLLRERRSQRSQLERQARQLESLLAIRKRDLDATPPGWQLNPTSGFSVMAGALAAMAAQVAFLPAEALFLGPATLIAAGGAAWTIAAAALRPTPGSDRRVTRMSNQVQAFRSRLTQIERDILHLEAE